MNNQAFFFSSLALCNLSCPPRFMSYTPTNMFIDTLQSSQGPVLCMQA